MGPYTHYAFAVKFIPLLRPEHPAEYFWGSIAPDIRYLAHMRRETTHLAPERLAELAGLYPDEASFLLGYKVHCLIDQVDIVRVVGGTFPLNLLRLLRGKGFSHAQLTMLVEMHFLHSPVAGAEFSGSLNKVLTGLGVTSGQADEFCRAMQEYIHSHSLNGALAAFQKIGMVEDTRVERYVQAYRSLEKHTQVLRLLLLGVKTSRLEGKVVEHVKAGLKM